MVKTIHQQGYVGDLVKEKKREREVEEKGNENLSRGGNLELGKQACAVKLATDAEEDSKYGVVDCINNGIYVP